MEQDGYSSLYVQPWWHISITKTITNVYIYIYNMKIYIFKEPDREIRSQMRLNYSLRINYFHWWIKRIQLNGTGNVFDWSKNAHSSISWYYINIIKTFLPIGYLYVNYIPASVCHMLGLLVWYSGLSLCQAMISLGFQYRQCNPLVCKS